VANNGALLAQYPELYAAIDANNTVQQNGKAMAEAIWKIKKQLLINELTQQRATVQSNIEALKTQLSAAVTTYDGIARAVAYAWGVSSAAQLAKAGADKKAAEDALADAEKQGEELSKLITSLEKQKMPTVTVGGGGGGGGRSAGSSVAAQVKSDFEKAKEAIEDYANSLNPTKEKEIEMWQELSNKRSLPGSGKDIFVRLNGDNILNKTDQFSTFFQIEPGRHEITYDADDGAETLQISNKPIPRLTLGNNKGLGQEVGFGNRGFVNYKCVLVIVEGYHGITSNKKAAIKRLIRSNIPLARFAALANN